MKKLLGLLFMIACGQAAAQSDSTEKPLKISGYVEAYYAYDFGKPDDHQRPGFVYSHNRHNEVNLNLGMIKAGYEKGAVRANLGLMAGTYANANLAAEPGVLRNVFEANAGVKISKNKSLWVDAGIFASHIGFESAIGKDCWNLTRSILADNSPYFESGAKLTYTSDNGKWLMSALLLNGWQRITRPAGNNTPAFGHQVTFKPSDKITLNSSSFVGNDMPDSTRQMRYFHNFYGIFQLHERFGLTLGFDIGRQMPYYRFFIQNWYAPIMIARVKFSERLFVALRAEYYADPHGAIIQTTTPHGFKTMGYSMNLDYLIRENVMWRVEGRGFQSQDAIFRNGNTPSRSNHFVSSSLAVSF